MGVIDVNDNDPLFEYNTFSVTYSIREDISRNSTIATIRATDADIFPNNRIVFDILSDPSENNTAALLHNIFLHNYYVTGTLFKIDHETGLLQTEAGHGPDGFDYELFMQYSIIVIVSLQTTTSSDCHVCCMSGLSCIFIGLQWC